jgi:hypothetical protein
METIVNKEPPDKRTRPDRAAKIKDRKNGEENVVKCTLSRIIADKDNKDVITKVIKERVDSVSKRTYLAGVAVNRILKEVFEGVPDAQLHTVSVPSVDQNFIRQLMVGSRQAHMETRDATVERFFHNNYWFREKIEGREVIVKKKKQYVGAIARYDGDRNLYSHASKKYLTNFNNHYRVHLSTWIKKFVYSKENRILAKEFKDEHGIDETVFHRYLLYDIHSWGVKEDLIAIHSLLPERTKMLLKIQHSIIGQDEINRQWLKSVSNSAKMIRYNVFINRYLEATEDEGYAKLVNIAPIPTVKHSFITIDTDGLLGVLKDVGLVESLEKTLTNKEHWESVFDVENIRSTGKGVFTCTIDTDGVMACTHFLRAEKRKISIKDDGTAIKKQTKTLREFSESDPNVVVVANDPGRCNIAFLTWKKNKVEEKDNGGRKRKRHCEFGSKRLTRERYYVESGVFKSRGPTKKWLSNIQDCLDDLKDNSPKRTSLESFDAYVTVMVNHWDSRWGEMSKSRWGAQRLRLYGGKKRVLARFFNEVQADVGERKTIVIAYGSSKFAPGGKGELSVPTTSAFNAFSDRFKGRVAVIDEFRTTKIWHKDSTTVLQSVQSEKKGRTVRGLLWCSSTMENSKLFVNRDLNAAINIHNCFTMYPTRPGILARPKKYCKLEVVVGRTIDYKLTGSLQNAVSSEV